MNDSDLIVDVNNSVWGIIRRKYWLEAGLLLPLIIGWEYLLLRYFGPELLSGNASSAAGRGFAFLAILPVILIFAWWSRLKKQVEDKFLANFARANGYSYEAQGAVGETYGSIFRIPGTSRASDIISGTYHGQSLRLFLYDLTQGSGRSQVVYRNTIFELTVPGQVPAMFLNSKHSHNFGLNVVAVTGIHNTISLEGDFDDRFTLHAAQEVNIEALEVFAPNLMAMLEDESRGYDIEFIAGRIYIYLDKYINTAEDLQQIFRLGQLLIDNVAPVSTRLAHDVSIAPAPVLVDLKRTSNITRPSTVLYGVVIGLFILLCITAGILNALQAPTVRSVANPAFDQVARQAEADLAASTVQYPLGGSILADGRAALAASRTNRGRSNAQYYIGMGYFWESQYQNALDAQMDSIASDSANSAAFIMAGEQLVNLGRPNEAIVLENRALMLDPQNSSALRTQAFAYSNLGRTADAVAAMDRATQADQAPPKRQFLSYDVTDRQLILAPHSQPLQFRP